jgi:sacsin
MELTLLRSFPIFSSFSSDPSGVAFDLESSSSEQHVTLGDISRLTTQLFPDSYLKHANAEELALLHHLGVRIVKRVEYFKQEFIPNAIVLFATNSDAYIHDSVEMLVELPSLVEGDRYFSDYLRAVEFVPSISDTPRNSNSSSGGGPEVEYSSDLRRVDEFYDPHDAELRSLLSNSFFPPPIYQRDDIISTMRSLGLQVTLDWAAVVTCARSISILAGYDAEPQIKRGESLLRYLDQNAQRLFTTPVNNAATQQNQKSSFSLRSLLFGKSGHVERDAVKSSDSVKKEASKEALIAELISINWIPVMTTISEPYIPAWCESDYSHRSVVSGLANAYQCRPYSDAWLCSASLNLCPLVIHSAHLLKALGWDKPLIPSVIAVQLRELSKQYQICAEATRTDQSEEKVSDIQALREKITQLIPGFYQYLNSSINSYGEIIHKILDDCSWIWLGDLFISPSDVAYSSPLNMSPYLHLVPRDLAVYSKLLNAFGVRQSFSGKDYVEVLRRLAFDSGVMKDAANVIALSESQTDLALSLVSLLNSDSGAFNSVNHGVYLPDYCNKMALSTELVIDDVPWLSGPEYSSIRSGIRFLHSNVAASFASKAGVRSLRLLLIDRNVEQIFSASDTTMEAFGQVKIY